MNKQVFFLILSLALLASCQRELDWDGAPEIEATVEEESGTRTSLSVNSSGTGTIYWNPSDMIDVFFGTKKVTYTSQNSSNATTATFKTSGSVSASDVASTNIWGLYPANSSSSCNGSAITTTLPSTQYGVANTFDDDLFPAIAHSSSTSLQFYNICGGIKFNMVYDDIKKVTFKGNNNENIAGTVSVTFTNGVPKATVTSGVKQITLTPKSGSTFTKGADYYITLLPGTLSKGFTITFTATDGTVGTLNYTDASVTIKRSVFSRKGNMDVYAAFGDGRQPNNVIYYTTSDGSIVEPALIHNGYTVDYGANIVSNEYVGGRGIITFDGDVTSIGYYAFSDYDKLTSIWLPDSLTSIMDGAFAGCSSLTSIDIPNSVAQICKFAFSHCSGLTAMVIPSSVKKIESFSFQFCTSLTTLVIPDSVNIIGMYAFSNCTSLASLDIPNSVSEIWDGAFASCSSLTSLVIPSSVVSIDQFAFTRCTGLIAVEIPSTVTSIGNSPFVGCTGLKTLTVKSGNPVYDSRNKCNAIIKTATNELISGCGSTVIPNTVTGIGAYAFDGYTCFTSFEIPAWVTSIGDYAFYQCTSLTSIVDYAPSAQSLGENAFDNTNNCPIYVPTGSVNSYKSAWSVYASRIQAIPQNNVVYYTTSDGDYVRPNNYAFGAEFVSNEYDYEKNCFVLTFAGDVTKVGDQTFDGCSTLTSLTLPPSVTSLGWNSFWGCTSLATFIIQSPTPPSIESNTFEVGEWWELPNSYNYHIFVPEGSLDAYYSAWDVLSGNIYAIMPSIATSFYYPTANGQTIRLSERKVYSVPMFKGINLKDNKGNWVMYDGEWVVGNGVNGIPLYLYAPDFYNISTNFQYDTYGLPSDIEQRISFDWENNCLTFDYSEGTDPVEGSFEIPFMVRFDSMFGSYTCYYSITIIG